MTGECLRRKTLTRINPLPIASPTMIPSPPLPVFVSLPFVASHPPPLPLLSRTFGRFVLLMDAVHTPSESQIIGASPAQAGLAMETLARFHALNWNQCR